MRTLTPKPIPVLLLPGLNQRAEALLPWANWFAQHGLASHVLQWEDAPLTTTATAKAPSWPTCFPLQVPLLARYWWAQLAQSVAQLPSGEPPVLFGFSLGGLLGALWGGVFPVRLGIWVSPAWQGAGWTQAVAPLVGAMPAWWRVPSLAPKAQRVRVSTSLGAYQAIRALQRQWRQLQEPASASPGWGWSAPQWLGYTPGDELVAPSAIKAYARQQTNTTLWQGLPVGGLRHQLPDPATTGQPMAQALAAWLSTHLSSF